MVFLVNEICDGNAAGLQNPVEMRNNTKGIGRSKIKPHERIRAGAGAKLQFIS